jgi:hypothetical protein
VMATTPWLSQTGLPPNGKIAPGVVRKWFVGEPRHRLRAAFGVAGGEATQSEHSRA